MVPTATFACITLGTIAHCAAVTFKGFVNTALQTTTQAIHRTEGTLMAVLGSAVFVSWNTSRRVAGHLQNCLHFTRAVHAALFPAPRTRISTGKVFAGSVGTEGQRFFTIFGECVRVVGSLSAASAQVDVAYCPCEAAAVEGRQRRGLRPVGWCRLPAERGDEAAAAAQYIVYQVALVDDDGEPGEEEWGWSPEYWSLFLARDFSSIRKQVGGANDPTLCRALGAWTDAIRVRSVGDVVELV
ncbi:hypothetical protein DIPPA_14867 [Diplonema papillatum]|nr:hypothetical protein DIPPA_14867 [Diplonema papillatum]